MMMRPTTLLFRGRYSSMLDMGGVGQAAATKRINVGKNNKVRAIALDFNLITRSIEERRALAEKENENRNNNAQNSNLINSAKAEAQTPIQPDTSVVQNMANLLGIKLGDSSHTNQTKKHDNDDLSGILGGPANSIIESNQQQNSKESTRKKLASSPPNTDIRSKYAAKLRNKIEGGVAGLELAKSEKEDTLTRGDASIHLAARNLISAEGAAGSSATSSSSRWLATTGVGKLLSYVNGRSMQIALLPLPSTPSLPQSDEDVKQTLDEMTNLTTQLPKVSFDVLIPDGRRRGHVGTEEQNEKTAQDVLANALTKMDVEPIQFVVVSDRDDYLGAARDLGMFTCRVKPKNKRRGLTTNYNVDDIGSVLEVINDINGVSFNSALKG